MEWVFRKIHNRCHPFFIKYVLTNTCMKLMNEKYREAIEEAQRLSKKILDKCNDADILNDVDDKELKNINRAKSITKDYSAHKFSRKGVNIDSAWIKLWLRYNSRYIYSAASAAIILIIVSLLIFIPLQSNRNNNIFASQDEIMPASEVVSLKLASGEIVSIDSISSIGASLLGVILDSKKQEISYSSESNNLTEYPNKIDTTPRNSIASSTITDIAYNELTIPKGRSYSLVLSDGTRVWLNAQSSIRYPVRFGEGERRVKISGEAFFDVKHDSGKLFIAETEDYNVKVLGTKFNISSYSDETIVATTLVSGSISISSNNNNNRVETKVAPGEQFRYNKKNKNNEITKVDTDLYTSWIDNNLRIKQMSLEDIFKILCRRYDIYLFYSDEGTKYEKFSGKIPLNDNLNVILDQISTISKVEFQIEKKLIVIRYKD